MGIIFRCWVLLGCIRRLLLCLLSFSIDFGASWDGFKLVSGRFWRAKYRKIRLKIDVLENTQIFIDFLLIFVVWCLAWSVMSIKHSKNYGFAASRACRQCLFVGPHHDGKHVRKTYKKVFQNNAQGLQISMLKRDCF